MMAGVYFNGEVFSSSNTYMDMAMLYFPVKGIRTQFFKFWYHIDEFLMSPMMPHVLLHGHLWSIIRSRTGKLKITIDVSTSTVLLQIVHVWVRIRWKIFILAGKTEHKQNTGKQFSDASVGPL